jgi:uncharacterized protein with von Willebrand factor type A (vWA) domain
MPRSLDAHLLTFARALRRHELLVSANEVGLALSALTSVDLSDREDVRLTLRSVFATTPREQERFDRLFELYWRQGLSPADEDASDFRPQLPPPKHRQRPQLLDWLEPAESEQEDALETMSYSPQEVLASSDFASVQTDQLTALTRLVARLAQRLATRLSHRYTLSYRRDEHLDFRRTLRRSLSHGGEPLDLSYQRRQRRKTRLVFLFDVSGSMMVYSQFLLQLALAFVRQRKLGRTEVFGFATDLYRLTETLRQHGVTSALRAAQFAMPGRSGGTKIGSCLQSFLENYGALLDPRTVVIIASDGWDTGDLELLEQTMRTLSRRSARLIWLNPLAGSPGYEPTASGMQTALPHIDHFAPAHNLESLRLLETQLSRRAA